MSFSISTVLKSLCLLKYFGKTWSIVTSLTIIRACNALGPNDRILKYQTKKWISVQGAKRLQDAPEASVARFMCGLMAGTLAKLATHPLDVAKKRFQVSVLQAVPLILTVRNSREHQSQLAISKHM